MDLVKHWEAMADHHDRHAEAIDVTKSYAAKLSHISKAQVYRTCAYHLGNDRVLSSPSTPTKGTSGGR